MEAEAAFARAQADMVIASLNIDDTQIRAPLGGVVGNRSADLGGYAVRVSRC
ncbi:MAG: hypothetical protein POH28_01715 [Acidocella sp.]|nr:hypothetical protein [Acidocella sp.]